MWVSWSVLASTLNSADIMTGTSPHYNNTGCVPQGNNRVALYSIVMLLVATVTLFHPPLYRPLDFQSSPMSNLRLTGDRQTEGVRVLMLRGSGQIEPRLSSILTGWEYAPSVLARRFWMSFRIPLASSLLCKIKKHVNQKAIDFTLKVSNFWVIGNVLPYLSSFIDTLDSS